MEHQLNKQNTLGEVCRFSASNHPSLFEELFKTHRPFVIRDFSKKWKAYKKWDLDYLIKQEGNSKILVRDGTGVNQEINAMQFNAFAHHIKQSAVSGTKQNFYLVLSRIMAHHNARSIHVPRLLRDIIVPSFIPFNRLWEINLWIGACSNRSNLHFDPEENLLVPIRGVKKLVLIDRSHTKNVYQNLEGNILESKVNIFDIDCGLFSNTQKIKFYETTIEPGEALYIPSGWWHAVESSEDINISVNMWWLPTVSFLFKSPTCRRLWQKREKWGSVCFPALSLK